MSFVKKLLITRLILFLAITLPLVAMAGAENQSDAGTLNSISQGNLDEIDPNDKTKLSPDALGIRTKQEEMIIKRNQKRLDHYKSKLTRFTPPQGEMSILVTGYSSTPDQTWGDPFTTASGTHVHGGTMACPPQYPFGTKINIESRGTFICEDRGGAIKGNHFDMWFPSRADALSWGKRIVTAEITK